jgi:hypothetical protein
MDTAVRYMVCLATEERFRVPLIAPALAPLLGMVPAEIGPLLHRADGVVVECVGARVPAVVQLFAEKGYATFVVPSAAAPAPDRVRSIMPLEWGSGGLAFQMNARGTPSTVPWQAVLAIGVTTTTREVALGSGSGDLERNAAIVSGFAVGGVVGAVAENMRVAATTKVGPSGTAQEPGQESGIVSLLVQNPALPAGHVECLECTERHVKYEFLGPRKTVRSSQNFALFLRDLLDQAQRAFAPASVLAVAAGQRAMLRTIHDRSALTMFRRWLLACSVACGGNTAH